MAKIDISKFINLMNKEYKNNGRSNTFERGEYAILSSGNPHFIFESVNKIKGINKIKASEQIANIKLEDYYTKTGTSENFALRHFIDYNISMCEMCLGTEKKHLDNILLIHDKCFSSDFTRCLKIATKSSSLSKYFSCFYTFLLNCTTLYWEDFEVLYKVAFEHHIMDRIILDSKFLEVLSNENLVYDRIELIDLVISKLLFKKLEKEAILEKAIVQNVNADLFVRFYYFSRLIKLEPDVNYVKVAESLIQEIKRDKNFAPYPRKKAIGKLTNYIENWKKKNEQKVITEELNDLINNII